MAYEEDICPVKRGGRSVRIEVLHTFSRVDNQLLCTRGVLYAVKFCVYLHPSSGLWIGVAEKIAIDFG